MATKTVIEVEISKIKVDPLYYSFHYMIKVNGKYNTCNDYDSDHDRQQDLDKFKKSLETGYAVELALEHIKSIRL